MVKQNCWEAKKCGRQFGGDKARELGVCPAYNAAKLTGVHGGRSAGRACWVVAGTLCGGAVQGTFASKMGRCMDCDFYKQVKEEEGEGFQMSSTLRAKLK